MRSLLLAVLVSLPVAAAAEQAVVWLPPESYARWSEVDALMRAQGGLKLTIGLSPQMATPLAKAALAPWIERGRLELAARADGDPVMTAIAAHPAAPRPQDPLELAADARERLKERLGMSPTGFLPGAGAVDAAVAEALAAGGAEWILAGPYAAGGAWAAAGKAILVPSDEVNVYDESASTASVFAAAALEWGRPSGGWATVGELARPRAEGAAPAAPAASVAAWPARDPAAAEAPPSDPGARAAWDAYGAAAAALERYQNSGSADLRTLDAASTALRKAQAARLFRPTETGRLASAMRSALIAVYKRLKIPAPDALYGSAAPAAGSAPEERPTGVRAQSGPSWVQFDAPAGSIALCPRALVEGATAQAAAPVADCGAGGDPWRLKSLRAEWDDAAVRLLLRVGRVAADEPRPIYEMYVDFNRVLGAGRVPLLEGRGAVVHARDAWELALSIAGGEARLYRARGGAETEELAVFKAERDSQKNEISVSVPRSHMRGNPGRWGWAAVALAEDPARRGRHPAASLVGPDGTILLGILAPAELQKPILSRANARVPAARLEP